MDRDLEVAVVGGGWAGLACAVTLADAGVPVCVYEAAPQLGGRARSVDWDGLRIDNGQHLMIGAYRETLALLTRLGTSHWLQRERLRLQLPGFRLHLPALPGAAGFGHIAFGHVAFGHIGLGLGLLRAQGLTLREKWAAARFMHRLQTCHFRLAHDQTASELLQGQPQALVEKLWAPLCIAALNTPVASASAQVFCNVLRDSIMGAYGSSDLLFNRADLGRILPDAAATCLQKHGAALHLSTRIEHLHADDQGFLLDARRHARVVLATHPVHTARLLTGLPSMQATRAQLMQFSWQPIVTLWLRFAGPVTLPFPMLGLGPGQAPWAFQRDDIATGIIAIVESAEGPHLALTPQALCDHYLALLRQATGPLPALADWKLIAEKRATYACTPDLARPPNLTPQPGLYLAGDYTDGPYPATLEGAVQSGVQCAAAVLAEHPRTSFDKLRTNGDFP